MNDDHKLAEQLKRLKFRSWHRGTREMDLLLGRFADAHLAAFSPAELDQYEELLKQSDPDLYNWITGAETPLPEFNHDVMKLLCTYSFANKKVV
jgi:antitoxin CptB